MDYEVTFIASPELQAEKVEELTAKVRSVIESAGGSIRSQQQLGKKKLAYPIAKFHEGSYVFFEVGGSGEMLKPLENSLRLSDSVIRYLIIRVEKKKINAKLARKKEEKLSENKKNQQSGENQQQEGEVKQKESQDEPTAE
jgi:small subunit ribosomal protein S6